MEQTITFFAVAVLATVASAQTNAADPPIEQSRKPIEYHTTRGPVQLSPEEEEDARLVEEGVLPPRDGASRGTNALQAVSLRMCNVPLAVAAECYAELRGTKVTVQRGLNVLITVQTTGLVTKAQAANLIGRALAAKGLTVVGTRSGAVYNIEKK